MTAAYRRLHSREHERRRRDAEERVARRRATWTGGVARSFAELDEIGLCEWAALSGAERVLAIWPLTL